jgi:molecular chaperone DnaK (HSP70)
MMRLGIDFGTTRTVVAVEDRGNYPLVSFRDRRGSWVEWYASRIAARDGALVFGNAAAALRGEPGTWHLVSIKRLLGRSAPDHPVEVPGVGTVSLLDLLTRFLASLREALEDGSANVRVPKGEPLEVMISTPANSNSNHRFLTLEAFKRAGFDVAGMINEPSAAGVEYAHRHIKRPDAPRAKEHLAVYDLGGGTFDAAAIRIAGMRHEVISSEGVEQLGGDDFDRILLEMVAEPLGGLESLDPGVAVHLLDECRERKEALNPNTRKVLVDTSEAGAGVDEVVVQVADFYDHCAPLVERTVECLERVLARLPDAEATEEGLPHSVATIYLVGGSTSFPLVARTLRERYGRRVQKSQYPHGAVAIGLAVAANPEESYFVRETLTRHFGVWREADSGSRVVFDPIFVKDAALDGEHVLRAERRYRPAHNVGHFRFVECASLSPAGDPEADVAPWDEIAFPFDRALHARADFGELSVERTDPERTETIVEEYTVDPNGIVVVTLRSLESGFERSFRLSGSRTVATGGG